jgi:hypothetical protein
MSIVNLKKIEEARPGGDARSGQATDDPAQILVVYDDGGMV